MNIAIFVPGLSVPAGREANVSAHISIPSMAASAFARAGHKVTVVTTRAPTGWTLPAALSPQVSVVEVTDARQRSVTGTQAPATGYHLAQLARFCIELRRALSELQPDVVHFFGFTRTVVVAAATGVLYRRAGVFATSLGPLAAWTRMLPLAAQRLSFTSRYCRDVSPERFARSPLACVGYPKPTPPWALKEARNGTDRTVLFWREASRLAGADWVVEAVNGLASRYPRWQFVFAVRYHWDEVPGLEELSARHENVQLHRFPYGPGLSIEKFLNSALIVVLPFRGLTAHPQLAVLESMAAGCAVVTTHIESNLDLIVDGETGVLLQDLRPEALQLALLGLLENVAEARQIGQRARTWVYENFQWERYVHRWTSRYSRSIGSTD